jgi:hypothetical protein
VKRFLILLVLLILGTDCASADGEPRFVEEGAVRVRFYFDRDFHKNHLIKYRALQSDLVGALAWVGKYRLGMRFELDSSAYQSVVDLGKSPLWSRAQLKRWLDEHLPLEPGIVKVLIHSRGMTADGACSESVDEGITWRGPAGRLWSQVVLTAKVGCEVKSLVLQSQVSVKNIFVAEMGRALGLDDARATLTPWQSWTSADIESMRLKSLGPRQSRQPRIACYEYSSREACESQCANAANFPTAGADVAYDNCVRTYCSRICN